MKKGLSYWSFPGGLSGEKDILQAAREARDAGYDAIELALSGSGQITMETPDADIERLAAAVRAEGIEISSAASVLTWDFPLTAGDDARRARAIEIVTRGLRVSQLLGVDCFLVIPGAVDIFFNPAEPIVRYDHAMERLRRSLDVLVPVAEKHGVAIGLENVWNKFLLSPLEVRDLVDSYGSSRLGVYLDTGNIMLTGHPEHWIEILGERIKRVHFKDFSRSIGTVAGFVDLLEGDVKWPAVMASLRAIGYDGCCTAELIPCYAHAPHVRIANASRAMDAIFQMG